MRTVSIEKILQGDRRETARAISLIENEMEGSLSLLVELHKHTGKAYRIGITGPPGAGKSTLTNRLALWYRKQNLRVGIIAVDPTSPFTGGALLGDRVRMTDVELDTGVFVRSMASRGSLGGLSRKTGEAADILDAGGADILLLETVGVGQSELDIAGAADTTIVVLVPESGDGIQAMKAGLMEIADFFVMNKSDRPGSEQAMHALKLILGFRPHTAETWMPDVLPAAAASGKGIDEICGYITRHRNFLENGGMLESRRSARMRKQIQERVEELFRSRFWTKERTALLVQGIESAVRREHSPYLIAEELLRSEQSSAMQRDFGGSNKA